MKRVRDEMSSYGLVQWATLALIGGVVVSAIVAEVIIAILKRDEDEADGPSEIYHDPLDEMCICDVCLEAIPLMDGSHWNDDPAEWETA
jgi:hypothetical protein